VSPPGEWQAGGGSPGGGGSFKGFQGVFWKRIIDSDRFPRFPDAKISMNKLEDFDLHCIPMISAKSQRFTIGP